MYCFTDMEPQPHGSACKPCTPPTPTSKNFHHIICYVLPDATRILLTCGGPQRRDHAAVPRDVALWTVLREDDILDRAAHGRELRVGQRDEVADEFDRVEITFAWLACVGPAAAAAGFGVVGVLAAVVAVVVLELRAAREILEESFHAWEGKGGCEED